MEGGGKRKVEIGIEGDDLIEVKVGLKEGERIVIR